MGGAKASPTVNSTERLSALRELMSKEEVDAYVIPSEDQHSSEYLADCDARRAFISGFNGSAGCAIITKNDAYMFTDGRYFLQAAEQMDSNWTLMKQGLPDVPTWQEFLNKNLPENSRIGIDPTLILAADAKSLNENLTARGSKLVSLTTNLVDQVWASSRPARPKNTVFPLPVEYAGQSSEEKIKKIREEITKQKASALVVNTLDEVAWLFNLRGSDIDYNPVFFAYAIITQTASTLYISPEQLANPGAVGADGHLGTDVQIKPYEAVWDDLKQLAKDDEKTKVLVGSKASLAIVEAIGQKNANLVKSPVADAKAIKNETEVYGFRQCHLRDGAALIRYFAWLEEQLEQGAELSESTAADQLEKYRSENELFKGLSFPTISSTGPNGAIIHYTPSREDSAIIKKEQMYLCDSGAQYLDGTTDVTRTLHFGTPTAEEKRSFTRVLQGHIAIDTAIFPSGVTGYVIDAYARRALWQDGLDYRHGTGHGVGHFLNVHEGPQGIGMRPAYNETPLKKGMTVSNGKASGLVGQNVSMLIPFFPLEPGYYEDGKYGIRIESIVIVREAGTPNNFGNKGYLGFEHVTMCPIQSTLVDASLMAPWEIKWLDDYHAEVLEKVKPFLEAAGDKRAITWLERECKPLAERSG